MELPEVAGETRRPAVQLRDSHTMVDLAAAYDGALAACAERGFDALTESERVLVAIWWLEADVNNGGFDQYLFNSGGDYAHYVEQALRLVGAHGAAAVVSRVASAFGRDGIPRDRRERQVVLDSMSGSGDRFSCEDEEFLAYPDDIAGLVERYLERDDRVAN